MAASRVDYVEDIFTLLVKSVLKPASTGAVVITNLVQFIISGGELVDVRYPMLHGVPKANKPGESPQTWTSVDQVAFQAENGAYAAIHKPGDPPGKLTPTFVRGTAWVTGAETHTIRYSHDGINWTVCHTIPTSGRGFGWSGATWNPVDEKFYLCLHIWQTADSEGSDTIWEEAQFFSSSDGVSWSPGDKFITNAPVRNPDDDTWPAPLIYFLEVTLPEWQAMVTAKFQELLVKPENRGGIPDGYQAYDTANEIFMKPTALRGWTADDGIDSGAPTDGITIEGVSHPTTSPPGWCLAVSFAGGIWNALCVSEATGNDVPIRIYSSTDEGRTWLLAHENHGAPVSYGMLAGRAADFTLSAPTEG